MPSYLVRVRGMAPNPTSDNRADQNDRWLPPKRLGSNVPCAVLNQQRQRVPLDLMFYHDETSDATRLTNPAEAGSIPNRFEHYKTYSIYHARSVLFGVNYDAIETKVGDGKHREDDDDESSSDRDDDEPYDNWSELKFNSERVQGPPWFSYVGCRGRERRLAAQRPGQAWIQHLIPDRYQSHELAPHPQRGGLVGELPILIGLVAMSLPPAMWYTTLPQTITNQWSITQDQINHVERGSQWLEKRGVVVSVFRDSLQRSQTTLENYERGFYGPIFPLI